MMLDTFIRDNTSSVEEIKTKVIKGRPTASLRKRLPPKAFTATQKKLKPARSPVQESSQTSMQDSAQKSTQNSTPAVREKAIDIDEYLEQENLMLHGAQEDDEGPDSEDDVTYFDLMDIVHDAKAYLKKSNSKAILNDKNDNSDFENNATEGNIKPDPNLNLSTNDSDPEYKDLDTLPYSDLREMCNDPNSKTRYGCDTLFTATMRAKFRGKGLDELHVIDRNKIPKKYHEVLDQVIHEKTLVMFDET
jgi:hypothetical protein